MQPYILMDQTAWATGTVGACEVAADHAVMIVTISVKNHNETCSRGWRRLYSHTAILNVDYWPIGAQKFAVTLR